MLAECATRLVDDTVEREHDDVAPPLLGRGRDGALRVVPRAARGVGAWEDGIIDGERAEEGAGDKPDDEEEERGHGGGRSDAVVVEELDVALEELEPDGVIGDKEDDRRDEGRRRRLDKRERA